MRSITLQKLVLYLLVWLPMASMAQSITNVNTSSQNCQCDTVTVFFTVTSPLNAGNQFTVELSTSAGTFPGTFIQINPLLGFNIGAYSMPAVIPCTSSQGLYKIRIHASNPVLVSDTLSNIIVGRRPNTNISVYGTYTFGQTQRFCDGDTAILVGPAPPLGETHQYQWFQNGAPMPGETNDTLIVTTSGSYGIKVTLGLCDKLSTDTVINAYTPPAFIFSNPDPAIVVISTVGQDSIQMCQGTVATLQGPTTSSSMLRYRYQWMSDSIGLFGQKIIYPLLNDTNATLNVTAAGRYYIEVLEDIGGCRDTSAFFSVFVDTIPTNSITNVKWAWQSFPTLNLCPEDSVLLSVTDTILASDITYQWQVSYPIGTPWQDIPGAIDPWITYSASVVPDTIEFRVVVKNLTCTYITNSVTVNYINNPTFSIFPGDSVSTCVGDSVLVQLIGNAVSYNWSDGFIGPNRWVKTAGNYTIEAVGVNQCTSFDTLKVGIFVVNANAGPDITIYRPEVNAQLNASGGLSYYWYADKPTYFNNQFIANPKTQPTADTTLYFVEVTGPNGCKATDSVYVYVLDTLNEGALANIQNVITPNGDGRNDFLNIPEILKGDNCEIIIMNRWGAEVYRNFPYNNNWNGVGTGGSELPDGTYYFIVKFENDIRFKGPITIIRNSK